MSTKTGAETPVKKEVAFTKSATKEKEKKDGRDDPDRPRLSRQVSKEAIKALSGGIGDAIVDLRLSANEQQEADLSRNGYIQLFQDKSTVQGGRRSTNQAAASTFGNRCSLWTWSRSQGTCSGRLKPIVDVQLHSAPTSSDFVLSGYTCDTTPISGQWLWIKRATTDEEEKDAIVDLYVSTGKMKDTSDPIWTSPGVGWVRVDGNFTKSFFGGMDSILWLRPARTRSMEVHMASPIRAAVALTEEVRFAKLMSACRLTLRNYVSVENVKRLATIVMETAAVSISAGINSNVIRSERMVDFTSLYHQTVHKGNMNQAALNKLLFKVGLRFDAKDLVVAFSLFDRRQNGLISLEEFSELLSLTDYELDLALEKIRVHLLKGCSNPNDASAVVKDPRSGAVIPQKANRPNAGVLGSGIVSQRSTVGKNIIRENFTLVQVFEMVNSKDDGIFSLDEMMDLATKVEVFLTEEEARLCLNKLDLDGDDRVEEADFISFMRQESNALIHKAFRVRECASTLRRWLVRGTTDHISATSTASASDQQWKAFKTQYKKHTRRKFPGYLDAQTLMITMSNLGTNLSALEARELTLLVAPEKNGRVHQADLHSFMGREHRSYGELIALLERDLIKDLIDAYRAHDAAFTAHGVEDVDLAAMYRRMIGEAKNAVEKVYLQPPPGTDPDAARNNDRDGGQGEGGEDEYQQATNSVAAQEYGNRLKRTNMEVISIQQLKDGMEFYFKENENATVSEPQLPNLEEWASLSVLVNADVCDGDIYGVRLRDFLEGICSYAVAAALNTRLRSGERLSVEQVSRELQRQIYVEALNCGKGKKPDFRPVFDVFDQDKNGTISMNEFKEQLKRLQLVNKLAEHQLPTLLAMFSKNKNQVKYEDFVAFAMKGGKETLDASDDEGGLWDKEDQEDEDDIEDMTRNIPPVAITRNGDCDWLLWYLYREARKVDPLDPESVITELQVRCNETEITQKDPAISVKEMWNHLFELSLQGGMTQQQFVKGVQLVCQHGNGKDDDRVDYEALCRYVVRMGRAFHALLQQRASEDEGKFAPLLVELKKYFQDLSREKVAGTDEKVGVARYEKIFRRIDTDGDGMLTPKEFKTGLRRLQYKSIKAWNLRMVRRLFDECDKNRDGLLSIREFTNYVQDIDTPERLAQADRAKMSKLENVSEGRLVKALSENKLNLSDDEEDEVFRKHKTLTDHQLLRKVNDTLMDVVPVDPHGPGRHAEVVRGSVRRFFQRADPEHRGTVSEERFRAFLRRSGLQDNLTTSELRRLTDKLKKRSTAKGEVGEVVIDYERLCQQLNVSTESIPKSKAEVVLSRFQDAANASAAAGRSFPSLCSLVDLHLSGRMTRDELIHTAKMMDYHMTPYDLEAMLELLPNHAVGSDERIDYRVLQSVLETFTPRQTKAYDIDPQYAAGGGLHSGALPAYASPGRMGSTSHMSFNFPRGMHASYNEISTPLGVKVQTPFGAFDDPLSATLRPGVGSLDLSGLRGSAPASSGTYERILRLIVERVKAAVEERMRTWGPTYNLREHLEYFDNDKAGTVPTRSFQQVMQEVGVVLSPSDLQTLYGLYGRPEDNSIFYDAFLRAVDGNTSTSYAPTLPAHMRRSVSASSHLAVAPPPPPTLGNNRTPGGAAYLHPRVLQRYRDLKHEGNDPRDFFSIHDVDRSGMIPQGKFAAVISKLQLLQTDHQLTRAIDDFSSISNRALVLYEDFLDTLDRSCNAEGRVSLSASLRHSGTGGFVNGSGYDGLRGSRTSNDGWEEDLRRFRQSNANAYSDYPIELEEGSDSAYGGAGAYGGYGSSLQALSPPKMSDSLSFSRVGGFGGGGGGVRHSPSRYRHSEDISPRTSYQRTIPIPKSSPSKVGSKMWGSDTPLARKGKVVSVAEGNWCCAVCLYTENSNSAQTCAVCDSPNYTVRKDYQVKEQCRNCTFLNGQFADECEMCGEPLSNSAHATKSFNKSGGKGRYLL